MNAEQKRLQDASENSIPWRKWGPYLSERQWGTVREDYSANGGAWDYFSHDEARSRAYRWGEDGLAGISDDRQQLCFALALWNGQDSILKERLFGLTNNEGNHGEDVKEYYFYLDSTPTHSYMKYLYKYPQVAYPYNGLVQTNRQRTPSDFEYELIDTGVFNQNRYFDVVVEYAKESPEDLLIQISVFNRGPEAATIHLLPTLWFRNTWADMPAGTAKPSLCVLGNPQSLLCVQAEHGMLGERYLYAQGDGTLLFTENETNTHRLQGQPNSTPYVKDGINDFVVQGETASVNPAQTGAKAAAHYILNVPPGASSVVHLRLTNVAPDKLATTYPDSDPLGNHFDEQLPLYGDITQFQEYFHGDNGAGLGANHQTGWTGLIARILQLFASVTDFKASLTAAVEQWDQHATDTEAMTAPDQAAAHGAEASSAP